MEQNNRMLVMSLVGALLTSIFIANDSITIVAGILKQSRAKDAGARLIAFEKIDKALESKPEPVYNGFKAGTPSPFRLAVETPKAKQNDPLEAKAVPLVRLTLKGILNKKNPLAIIEDETGKTYICREGDQVVDREVVEIGQDNVSLRGPRGVEVLKVKEQ